jgi:hypothetical protein
MRAFFWNTWIPIVLYKWRLSEKLDDVVVESKEGVEMWEEEEECFFVLGYWYFYKMKSVNEHLVI